ncbi:MAG TPA: 4'-phosphopantetheinyl transferase superfamily protein [Kofleriaceae bacterium]
MTAAAWRPPPADLALAPSDVHVWRVPLVQPPAAIAALLRTLGDDERARAARFHFDRDRNAYILARGTLRALAGRYLDHPPEALAFGYGAKGKPYLAAPPGDALRFNVSHSGELALIAFARGREIGVDIERRRSIADLLSLARISFSPGEYAALCGLPPGDHTEAFFACWSRKEAFIKATGEGVSQLADFDVSLGPGEPARLLRVEGEPWSRRRWSLQDLPAIPDYAAALVSEGAEPSVDCWDWPAM